MKTLVQFTKICRNYIPGDIAGLELAEPGTVDEKGRPVEFFGDRVMKVGAARRLTPAEAIKHLSAKEMKAHGYTDDEIKKALEKLDEKGKAKHEAFNVGEAERLQAEREMAKASIRR